MLTIDCLPPSGEDDQRKSSEWIELCPSLLNALPVNALQKWQEFLWISKDRTDNTLMWRSQSTSDGAGMLTRGVSWGNANIQRNGQKSENWKTTLTANCPRSTPTKRNLLEWMILLENRLIQSNVSEMTHWYSTVQRTLCPEWIFHTYVI